MAFRVWPLLCKLIQRQTYTCLSTRHGLWFVFIGMCIVIVSLFHFGEVLLQWSMVRYAGNFKIIKRYDNIAGKSFEHRLCLPEPIDIVYTWVNGSDPKLIAELNAIKVKLQKELNITGKLYASKQREKLINSSKFKWINASVCPIPNCVPAYKVAVSGIPRSVSLTELRTINTNFSTALNIEFWEEDLDIAFILFPSRAKVTSLLYSEIVYRKQKLNVSEVFYTSTIKNGHKRIETSLIIHNMPKGATEIQVHNAVERTLPKSVSKILLYPNDNLSVILFNDKKFAVTTKELAKRNFTINKEVVKLFPVTYVWKPISIGHDTIDEDLSSNRFADNNELRYSLRSVEKYAPWVRKIFIVTNSQIPNWLNLDHPRISIVTHAEIFTNKSHLPTFSSPAIESHIHRIPGLSKKFIYMNDDVFFGTEVWPDDFYTHSKGHKIFLSWAVPNCNEGCPSSWLNDKYCDKACNNSACDWDGGDCLGTQGKSQWQLNVMQQSGLYQHNLGEYCSNGCAHNWIGDRYCDGNCNVLSCGFDAGDCGSRDFKKIFSHDFKESDFKTNNIVVKVPHLTLSMYLNFTTIFDTLQEGSYDQYPVLRTAIFSKKYKTLSLTFFKNFTTTSIKFQVLGYKGVNKTEKAALIFNVSVDTFLKPTLSPANSQNITELSSTKITYPEKLYNESQFQFSKKPAEIIQSYPNDLPNMSLPVYLKERLKMLEEEFADGDMTGYGYNKSKSMIYQEYLSISKKSPKRKLLWYSNNAPDEKELRNPFTTLFSFLPWERGKLFINLTNIYAKQDLQNSYSVKSIKNRHLLDAFSSSLLHVSRIYNKAFGYQSRKVPAHMPHMVDRDIINEMQARFPLDFDETSSHKIRHPRDMQFAFSFNYYVIGVKETTSLTTIFRQVDTDHSGTLSDRELRSLTAFFYDLPITLKTVKNIEEKFKNCSRRFKTNKTITKREKYYDESLPIITEELFLNCHEIWRTANMTASKTNKYRHEMVGEDDVTFKMIRNNVTFVLYQLDWIRKYPRKFICLNDDLDHAREDTKVIRSILKDFYESKFPIPSQFELPAKFRNRFLYKDDLELWSQNMANDRQLINSLVIFCILLFTVFLYRQKCCYCFKRCCRFLTRKYYNREINMTVI